ncbi:MAG: hypothetical protein ACFCGT_16100, partial [Sandaracinaceae bacterium]
MLAVEVGHRGARLPDDARPRDEVLGLDGEARALVVGRRASLEASPLEVAGVDVEGDALGVDAARSWRVRRVGVEGLLDDALVRRVVAVALAGLQLPVGLRASDGALVAARFVEAVELV